MFVVPGTQAAVDGATLKQNDDICVKVLKAIETSQNLPNSLALGHQWLADLFAEINNRPNAETNAGAAED